MTIKISLKSINLSSDLKEMIFQRRSYCPACCNM